MIKSKLVKGENLTNTMTTKLVNFSNLSKRAEKFAKMAREATLATRGEALTFQKPEELHGKLTRQLVKLVPYGEEKGGEVTAFSPSVGE